MATGKTVASAEIQASKIIGDGQFNYLTIAMSKVSVSALSESNSAPVPTETMSLNYSRITITYTQQNPDGTSGSTTSACWDVPTNRQC
jgi:type VI protein secretion system component Hcp